MSCLRHLRAAFALVLTFSASVPAQQPSYNAGAAPRLAKPAPLVVPRVTTSSIAANGVTLRVVEQHELPLVQVSAVVAGGARLDGAQPGMATFVANMLDEGAAGRDAATLQSELAYLGASLSASADWDRITVSLKVATRNLAPALDLMADILTRPQFSAREVRRQRDLRLASLLQLRDQPEALADLATNQIVFPEGHPYHTGTAGDSTTAAALDSGAVRTFYQRVIRPERTTIVVVGDITPGRAGQEIDARFAGWRAVGEGAAEPSVAVPPREQSSTHIYFVDKPNAAQSVISIAWPGVERTTADYAALVVMNSLLGGSFTSRLNMNLREAHGYSYGAGSGFAFRRLPGPFTASSAVRSNVSDSALVEFVMELRRIRDSVVPSDELERAKAYVELNLPGALESTSQVASQIAQLGVFGLTLEELPRFAAGVRGVTPPDVQRVARRYLTPDRATIVIVGDINRVRASVDALGLGPSTRIEATTVAR